MQGMGVDTKLLQMETTMKKKSSGDSVIMKPHSFASGTAALPQVQGWETSRELSCKHVVLIWRVETLADTMVKLRCLQGSVEISGAAGGR